MNIVRQALKFELQCRSQREWPAGACDGGTRLGFYGNSSNLIGLDSIFTGQFIPELPAATYTSYQMPGNYAATNF